MASAEQPRATASRSARQDGHLLAIALVVMAAAIIPINDTVAKLLSDRFSTVQLLWARYTFYLAPVLPIVLWQHGWRGLRSAKPWLQLLRSVQLFVASGCFYLAIMSMPVPDALAIAFVYPCAMTALSPLVLGERIGPWRWGAVLLGFIGALVVIRPGLGVMSPGAPFALACGLIYATYVLATRKLGEADPPLVTLALTSLAGVVLSSLALPFTWRQPSPAEWGLLAAIGLTTGVGHLLVILAYARSTPPRLAPFHYAEIAMATVMSFLLFGTMPDALTWVGIGIIVASGLIIAVRESLRRGG